MRRPALYTPRPTTGWSHPYPTGLFSPVFYNGAPAVPPVVTPPAAPTPADLARAAGVTPPAPAVPPAPAPVTPAVPAAGGDDDIVNITQRRMNVLMKAEKDEGRRAALRAIAETAGIDPDTVDLDQVAVMLKAHQDSARKNMTELERREAEVADRERKAAEKETAAAARTREADHRIILAGLGATGADLEDAAVLLQRDLAATPNATTDQVQAAATALKERRPTYFASAAAPAVPAAPPAPGGAPAAGGAAPRVPPTKEDASSRARKRAEQMGLRTADA